MVWVTAAIMAGSAIYGAISSSNQNKTQQAWNNYNAQMSYNNSVRNIRAQNTIAGMNAMLAMKSGQINAQMATDTAQLNASIIADTTAYNNELLAEDLALMWEAAELDIRNLEVQRAKERGGIRATHAASGTVMDEGSNAEIIADQMTQEAMDAFIIRHGADIQASKITNAMAQNRWQGEMQIKKTIWEGQMGAYSSLTNAGLSAMGGLMTAAISSQAGMQTASSGLTAGLAGAQMQYSQNQQSINAGLVQGLFSAGSQYVSSNPSTFEGNYGSDFTPADYTVNYKPGYTNNAGTSLLA